MARWNERPGRRSERDERSHAEPVLSFTPRDEFAEDSEPSLSGDAPAPQNKPRTQRSAPKASEPPAPKAPKPSVAGADRPLYLYMPPPRRRPGVLAAKSIAVAGILALIGVYTWHRYAPAIDTPPGTADDVLPALAQPQPLSSATYGAPNPSSPPAAAQVQETAPAPVASAPPPQPPTPKAPPPAAAANPPPQPFASAPPQAPAAATPPPPPKRETVKRETPHRDTSLDQAKPRDQAKLAAPSTPAPAQATIAPPSPAAAGPVATGVPLPLNQLAPPPQREAALPPPAPQPRLAPLAPAAAPPPPATDSGQTTGSNTVTIDGVTYVNGEQPHALGTIGDATAPDPSNASGAPPAFVAPQPTATDTMRSYVPRDTNSGVAPLPNDVIILPSGQMAVPSGQQ